VRLYMSMLILGMD